VGRELYDHSKDPSEWNNLAGNSECKQALLKLKSMFDEYKVFEEKR
jgi:hypothetical protein